MNDSFNRCYVPSVTEDTRNFPLHAGHPSLSAHPGRSEEQIKIELAQRENGRARINKSTGGRR